MIDLQKSVGISVRTADHVNDPNETTIGDEFPKDRMHLQHFQSHFTGMLHFAFVQTIDRQSRSIDQQRMILKRTIDYQTEHQHHFSTHFDQCQRLVIIGQRQIIVIVDVTGQIMVVVTVPTAIRKKESDEKHLRDIDLIVLELLIVTYFDRLSQQNR